MRPSKPCPFCGLKRGKILKGGRRRSGEWIWKPAAGCDRCGYRVEFDSVAEAKAWWDQARAALGAE